MDSQILEMHSRGLTATEIANRLGVSRVTINNHARKLGINFPRGLDETKVRELMNERKDEIIQRYKNGENNRKIAKLFRCNPTIVTTILEEWNIEVRKRPDNWGKLSYYEKEIREMHAKGLSTFQIGSKIGFDPSSIIKYCDKIGLQFAERIKVDDHIEEILRLRAQKYSLRQIAKIIGVTHVTVSRCLQDNEQSTEMFKINVNESFFESITNENQAYCLGLLLSDGFVQKGVVGLVMTDNDVINKFKNATSYDGNIRMIYPKKENHKIKYECRINSIKMYNDVRKYGIVENKSLTLKFPDLSLIPKNLLHHLIRGIHDGDGCLTKYKTRNNWGIIFTGTLEVLQGIEKVCGIKGQYEFIGEDGHNTWHWRIRKQSDIIKMLEWMYDGATIYMDRKKLKAEQCLADLRSRVEESTSGN